MQTKHAAKDPYLVNLQADEKELKLMKLQQTMVG